jgi:TolA-binding protein
VVSDAVLRSRKNLVEAEAFLELTRIFRSMGLMDGARTKAAEGLDRVGLVIREQQIPDELKSRGFQLKWLLHQEVEDYEQAVATIQLFHRMFPKSTLVDQALLSIASIKLEQQAYKEAIDIYRRVLAMEFSQARAEAQFMIAEAIVAEYKHGLDEAKSQGKEVDAGAWDRTPEAAIIEYRKVARQFRDSEFAGRALGKEVRHYIDTKDLVQANETLERVFEDYPDAQFLDEMLLHWVTVSYQMGDYARAYEKCQQLLVEFPNSSYAKTAQKYLPRIKEVMEQQGG